SRGTPSEPARARGSRSSDTSAPARKRQCSGACDGEAPGWLLQMLGGRTLRFPVTPVTSSCRCPGGACWHRRVATDDGGGRVLTPTQLLELDRKHVWHPYAPMPGVRAPYLVESAAGVRLRLAEPVAGARGPG